MEKKQYFIGANEYSEQTIELMQMSKMSKVFS